MEHMYILSPFNYDSTWHRAYHIALLKTDKHAYLGCRPETPAELNDDYERLQYIKVHIRGRSGAQRILIKTRVSAVRSRHSEQHTNQQRDFFI